MPPVKGYTKCSIFKKDENALPFFAFHPRTKLGAVLRVVLAGFMLLVIAINLVAYYAKISPAKAYSLYPLVYCIPVALVIALILLALFKRMRSTFTKILTAVISAFVLILGISLISTWLNLWPLMMVAQNGVSLPDVYTNMKIETDDGKKSFTVMHQYAVPDGSLAIMTDGASGDYISPLKTDSAEVIPFSDYESGVSVSGRLCVSKDEIGNVKVKWIDSDTAEIYLADGSTSVVPQDLLAKAHIAENSGSYRFVFDSPSDAESYGKIIVSFADAKVRLPETSLARTYFASSTSPDGAHTIKLQEQSVTGYKPASIYNFTPEDFKQVYTAYPSLFFNFFIKLDTKTDGCIVIEPNGTLNGLVCEYKGEDIVWFYPTDDTKDGLSKNEDEKMIIIHLSEKADSVTD